MWYSRACPDQIRFGLVKLYEDMAAQVNVTEFQVYKGFAALSRSMHVPRRGGGHRGSLESQLLDASIVLEDWERPSLLVKYIMEHSVPYAEFRAWGQRLGLFSKLQSRIPAERLLLLIAQYYCPNPVWRTAICPHHGRWHFADFCTGWYCSAARFERCREKHVLLCCSQGTHHWGKTVWPFPFRSA